MKMKFALVAHDNQKSDLSEWVARHQAFLSTCELFATGTTGQKLMDETGMAIHRYLSGPLGGDQQIGAAIAEKRLDALVFFWDPMSPQPHDPDVKALLRLAVLYNIPVAMNPATADALVAKYQLQS